MNFFGRQSNSGGFAYLIGRLLAPKTDEGMDNRLNFFLKRVGEQLWVKPLLVCVLSTAATFFAKLADNSNLGGLLPDITRESIESLLTNIAASMLVIATFAVGSMVSSYASASNSATPRSFTLIIADDVSQNSLSTFIGAFIFSIVALIALKNGYYGNAGRFALFTLTIIVFAVVIITFVRWLDSIARLGRLGTTISKVESATAEALKSRRIAPTLLANSLSQNTQIKEPIFSKDIGYIQRVDIAKLQNFADKWQLRIRVACLPGTFCTPDRPIAFYCADSKADQQVDTQQIADSFLVGTARTFDEDPRFGLIVLSEIANRALSPAVNDPGTAIEVIGCLVRLFVNWQNVPDSNDNCKKIKYDRIEVAELSVADMFDDAFIAIARGGADTIEVGVRLQKALSVLASMGDDKMRQSAHRHSRMALARAEKSLAIDDDICILRETAGFSN